MQDGARAIRCRGVPAALRPVRPAPGCLAAPPAGGAYHGAKAAAQTAKAAARPPPDRRQDRRRPPMGISILTLVVSMETPL